MKLSKKYFERRNIPISHSSDRVYFTAGELKTYGMICRLEGMQVLANNETVKYLINEKLNKIAKKNSLI